ncbi:MULTISPECIES: hypothetical protein [Haloferax]|uniref:hypothetical protein n=1 Tax=Haloferax TaxID=2251 RepID=UPI0017845971|nr:MULTISPECIES: hypothetical protein [Haloferax]
MRTRTFSDSIVSDASRYDFILATLPLPLFLGLAVGTLTELPVSSVVAIGGLVSVSVLAYGLFVVSPTSPANTESTATEVSVAAVDAPFNAGDASFGALDTPRDDSDQRRRRRGI